MRGTLKLVLALITVAPLLVGPGCSDNGDVIDPENQPPAILSLVAEPDTIYAGQLTTVTVSAEDPDGDQLEYLWDTDQQWLTPLPGQGHRIQLASCCSIEEEKVATIISTVKDGRGGEDSDSVRIWGLPTSK